MSAPTLKSRRAAAHIAALPATDTSSVMRATGVTIAAVMASSVFSAGRILAERVSTAL